MYSSNEELYKMIIEKQAIFFNYYIKIKKK